MIADWLIHPRACTSHRAENPEERKNRGQKYQQRKQKFQTLPIVGGGHVNDKRLPGIIIAWTDYVMFLGNEGGGGG